MMHRRFASKFRISLPAQFLSLVFGAATISACVLQPEWQRLAREGDLERSWSQPGNFSHLVLWNRKHGHRLHIYVEGDGSPWIRDSRIAVDPTPVEPVLLRLMLKSDHPAIYLGRPCYFGTSTRKPCEPRFWTGERYGEAVANSMCAAANNAAQRLSAEEVVLIGYSGGAAVILAMLPCTENVTSFISVAGNLDPQAWATYHRYVALVDVPDLKPTALTSGQVTQTHWQCRDDTVVPSVTTDAYFGMHQGAVRHIVQGCSHSKGWDAYWPTIIN